MKRERKTVKPELNCYAKSRNRSDVWYGKATRSQYYNSDLSIWISVDPLVDKYPNLSPYTYCAGNPVRLVDEDGRDIWEISENGKIINLTK